MNFLPFFSLHKLISVPTRITCKNHPERFTEQGIIDVRLSRKISGNKRGTHKHVKFFSFKHYWVNLLEEALTSITFSNYQNLMTLLQHVMTSYRKLLLKL